MVCDTSVLLYSLITLRERKEKYNTAVFRLLQPTPQLQAVPFDPALSNYFVSIGLSMI